MTRAVLVPERRREFTLAGRAVFTLVGRESRFTYRVERSDRNPNLYFVAVLTGPDNTADYSYLGTIMSGVPTREWSYRYGHKSQLSAEAQSARAFAWSWPRLEELEQYGAQFFHEGRCGRCSKALTDPVSISLGLGPTCAGKAA